MADIPTPIIAAVANVPYSVGAVSVPLDGTASTPGTGATAITSYQWVLFDQPTGAAGSLLNPTTATPSLELPAYVEGSYGIALYLVDDNPDPLLAESYDSYLPRQLAAAENGKYGLDAGTFVGPVPSQIVWVRLEAEHSGLVKPGRGDRGWFHYSGGLWDLYDLVEDHEAAMTGFMSGQGNFDDIYEYTGGHGIEMHHEVTMSAGAKVDTIEPVSNNSAVSIQGSGAHAYDLEAAEIEANGITSQVDTDLVLFRNATLISSSSRVTLGHAQVDIVGGVPTESGLGVLWVAPPSDVTDGHVTVRGKGTHTVDLEVDVIGADGASGHVIDMSSAVMTVTAPDGVAVSTTSAYMDVDGVRLTGNRVHALTTQWDTSLYTGIMGYAESTDPDPAEVVFPGGALGDWSISFWTPEKLSPFSTTFLGIGGVGTTELRVRLGGAAVPTRMTNAAGTHFEVDIDLAGASPEQVYHHVVLTFDGTTSTLTAYLNGASVDSVVVSGAFDAATTLTLGARYDGTDATVATILTGAAVWDVKLMTTAVAHLYACGPYHDLTIPVRSYPGEPVYWWGGGHQYSSLVNLTRTANGGMTLAGDAVTGQCQYARILYANDLSAHDVWADTINALAYDAGVTVKGRGTHTADLHADVIGEDTAGVGVTIDGVLLKDGGVTVADAAGIAVDGGAANITLHAAGNNIDVSALSGFHLLSGTELHTDTILEETSDAGVTIDSALLKDGSVYGYCGGASAGTQGRASVVLASGCPMTTPAGTSEETMVSVSLPANTLTTALTTGGAVARFRAAIGTAANGNTKVVRLKLDGTTLITRTSTSNNGLIEVEADIYAHMLTANTQRSIARVIDWAGANESDRQTLTKTSANALALALTFECATANTDLTLEGYTVEVLRGP